MNAMERILKTLSGDPLDRRAFIPVLSLYGARLTNCPLNRYYSDSEAYLQGQLAIYDEFQPDMLLGPFAFALIGAAFGSSIKESDSAAPNILKPAISSAAEWEQLPLPDPDSNPYLLYLSRSISQLAKALGGRVPVGACFPAPIDIPALVMGMEGWLEVVLFDNDTARRILEKVNLFFVDFVNRLFKQGATLAVLPCGYASPTVMMRLQVENLMQPAMKLALEQLSGPTVLHHAGAELLEHLPILADLPSAIGFALNQREGLENARRIIGADKILLSGPHGPSLAEMNATEVQSLCGEILAERAEAADRHFILASTGADIPLTTPPENIHAMRTAVLSAGWVLP